MKTISFKFSILANLVLLFSICTLLFASCKKTSDITAVNDPNNNTPDLVTKINSSVSGFVTNQFDAPVSGASVVVGTRTTVTDRYGYFEVKNVEVIKNAAVVTVSQQGYFKGIKTYMATEGKAAFFRIKLLPKANAGNVNAISGGSVSLSNGLNISLPANAVKNATTGDIYTGTVNVAATWIDPSSAELSNIMPGDLRGINTDSRMKILTTYGMAGVELTSTSGEPLQITDGKKATLTFPIPSTIAGNAPSTIPLWHFDETTGLWKEEGSAAKNGNTYVGEVSHFSFWNCDVPNNYVQFDLTLHNSDGSPIPFAQVRLTDLSGVNGNNFGYTDLSGYVGGPVPANIQLKVEVYINSLCASSNYSQTVTITNVSLSLGTIVINTSTSLATVTGTVVDCSNNPVSSGNVFVFEDWRQYTRYPLNTNGTFSFNRMLCSGTSTITLLPEDVTNAVQGLPVIQTLTTGVNTVGTLQACSVSTTQFLTWSVDGGTATTVSPPSDSLLMFYNAFDNVFTIGANQTNGIPTNNWVTFHMDGAGIAVGTTQALKFIVLSQVLNNNGLIVPSIPVIHITEYGPVGSFIAGNFNASIIDSSTSISHTVVCSFRIRRYS